MSMFKEAAYKVLKEAKKPMRSDEITRIALKKGFLNTIGKTPEATMNVQLLVDVNKKGSKSLFKKTAPRTFTVNEN